MARARCRYEVTWWGRVYPRGGSGEDAGGVQVRASRRAAENIADEIESVGFRTRIRRVCEGGKRGRTSTLLGRVAGFFGLRR